MTTSVDGGHIDWSIPAVVSNVSGREIRNTIGISSIKGDGTAEELMNWNIGKMQGTVEEVKENRDELSVTIKFEQDDKMYWGKSYYVTKDGMGYMITFVSTPETFDKNLKVFESFKSRIKFD
ncbi:MAG: hypothetical protein HRT57_02880 [Crocinitomicaceae bacterium]|nr:hypothetical protein [Crocinitomicaceae bacterium]